MNSDSMNPFRYLEEPPPSTSNESKQETDNFEDLEQEYEKLLSKPKTAGDLSPKKRHFNDKRNQKNKQLRESSDPQNMELYQVLKTKHNEY